MDTGQVDSCRSAALDFLERHNVMTIAVADNSSLPWAAPVLYVNDGFCLYWLTSTRGRLGSCLQVNPRATAAILSSAPEWWQTQGVQIEGRVHIVDSWREYLRCGRRFLRKLPRFNELLFPSTSRRLLGRAARMRFYRLEAERCWFTDQGVGSRVELDLSAMKAPTS